MTGRRTFLVGSLLLLFTAIARAEGEADLAQEVSAAESSFAASMAARDFEAFASHIADDAIFFGPATALRGKAAVLEDWRQFFEGEQAPFSWAPEKVEVLSSGKLAHSSGPVRDPSGKQVATFNSIWRLESDGQWRVVFDKGCGVCACQQAAEP
jgi:ketosteroid isomerase-like protein